MGETASHLLRSEAELCRDFEIWSGSPAVGCEQLPGRLDMAIISGHHCLMKVSVAEAKNHLSELLRSVEDGEQVVITRNGKPVAQLVTPPREGRVVKFGTMRGKIHLKPGWDEPINLDRFLAGEV